MAFRYIVRIAGTDLDGTKKVTYGLTKIKGVGPTLATAIVRAAGVDPQLRVGALTDSQLALIEDIISNPSKHGLSPWLFNRRRDPETGTDIHLIGADLDLRVKADIELMKELRSWKGIRHALGLKVRGQKTRTTARKGLAVGVKRKGVAAPAKKEQPK